MKYFLDTNVCIDVMRGRDEVVGRLESMSPDDCAISTVSLFELEAGARKSNQPENELRKVSLLSDTLILFPWDKAAARASAKIRFDLESTGWVIGAYDTLLAGHAMALGLVLVTDNIKEFSRVDGLIMENWRERSV